MATNVKANQIVDAVHRLTTAINDNPVSARELAVIIEHVALATNYGHNEADMLALLRQAFPVDNRYVGKLIAVPVKDLEIAMQNIHNSYHQDAERGEDRQTWKECSRPSCERIRSAMVEAGYKLGRKEQENGERTGTTSGHGR